MSYLPTGTSHNACRCAAYPFPHRHGGGRCQGPEAICEDCKLPTKGRWADFGIGSYEYWGSRGIDTRMEFVSECCDAPILNPFTLKPLAPEEYYHD